MTTMADVFSNNTSTTADNMKNRPKFFGLSLAGAFQDATRTTVSATMGGSVLPGFNEVKNIARRLVDSIEHLETHRKKRDILSHRITSTMKLLESHCREGQPSLELQYFVNKMAKCQHKLSSLDAKMGMSKALRAAQQLEVLDILESEINADFQDAIFAMLLRRQTTIPMPEPQIAPIQVFNKITPEASLVQDGVKPYSDYPKITRCELRLNTQFRRTYVEKSGSPLVKSVTRGEHRGRDVLVVQYSSKLRPEQALRTFMDDLDNVIQERHPNVLEFIGVSEDSPTSQSCYMVFETGQTISRDTFFQTTQSSQEIFSFLGGVKSGMQCLLDHGVHTWHDIYVSNHGRAVVCPPYWEGDFTWDKSNHDVFSSLTGTSGCLDFPLNTLTEILNISGNRWREFETAVVSQLTPTRDYHLMQIADELQLPVPPFLLVYHGKIPDFILTVGTIGIPHYFTTGKPSDCFHGSMNGWTQISSLWSCSGWEALQTCSLDYWLPEGFLERDGTDEGEELALSRSLGAVAIEPLESCSDGWLSYGDFESGSSFGVGYELVISDSGLFEMSWDRFCATRLTSLSHLVEEEQDIHVVKHISVSIHCRSENTRGLLPLYFHRRPSALFNVEHYWGFFSENLDPTVSPCQVVRNMNVDYSIEINTVRGSDSWAYRADKCLEAVLSKTPGNFEF